MLLLFVSKHNLETLHSLRVWSTVSDNLLINQIFRMPKVLCAAEGSPLTGGTGVVLFFNAEPESLTALPVSSLLSTPAQTSVSLLHCLPLLSMSEANYAPALRLGQTNLI